MAFKIPDCLVFKYDEWIFQAFSTMYHINRGNGCSIYEIAKYIMERHDVPGDFIPQLMRELGALVYEGEVEMSYFQYGQPDLDRYNIRFGTISESEETEVALVPLVINATETTTISKDYLQLQDQASTSCVPTESEKRAQLEEVVDAVIHAEYYEPKAKEINDVYYAHLDWTLENFENLCVARRLVIDCANGCKIYMRKGESPGPINDPFPV